MDQSVDSDVRQDTHPERGTTRDLTVSRQPAASHQVVVGDIPAEPPGFRPRTGLLAELEPVADSLVVTRNTASRSMAPDELRGLAEEVFGPDRVIAAPRLDDAIDTATTLADEGGDSLGGGRERVA